MRDEGVLDEGGDQAGLASALVAADAYSDWSVSKDSRANARHTYLWPSEQSPTGCYRTSTAFTSISLASTMVACDPDGD